MTPEAPLPRELPGPDTAPEQVVGRAIQELTAARLGRGFLPLAFLAATGLIQLAAQGPDTLAGWILFLGAPLTGTAMLAYGLRGVQRAFGRPHRPWMGMAGAGALLPLVFGLYVLGWRGLREMAVGGPRGILVGLVLTVLGAWALRGWLRVLEVRRLADAMTGIGGEEP